MTYRYKKWVIKCITALLLILALLGATVIAVDPYFHYHKPLSGLYYSLDNERSINDGIIKHFDYDAIVTGTSMAENFKTSQVDEIFDVNSIKVTFAGGTYNEINSNLETAFEYNDEIRLVIRPLDYTYLMDEADRQRDDLGTYPTYLYDDNPFNDVNYIFNKDVIFGMCFPMIGDALSGKSGGITSFDDYASWMENEDTSFGAAKVLADRTEKYHAPMVKEPLLDETKAIIKENIEKNVIALASNHPEVNFYYYISPYSVAWWGRAMEDGTLYRWIGAEEYAISLILECDNIHLYSFNTQYQLVSDLNNYSDECHYGDWVNTQILTWMNEGTGLLTKDNYEAYIAEETEFYQSFNYDSLLELK